MRAQGRLTSWKVTEYNLVIHKPDMQAAADHESYTQAQTYTTHKHLSSFTATDTQSVLQECPHKQLMCIISINTHTDQILLLCTPTVKEKGGSNPQD